MVSVLDDPILYFALLLFIAVVAYFYWSEQKEKKEKEKAKEKESLLEKRIKQLEKTKKTVLIEGLIQFLKEATKEVAIKTAKQTLQGIKDGKY